MAFVDTPVSLQKPSEFQGLGVGCVSVDRKQLWGSKKTTPVGDRGGEQGSQCRGLRAGLLLQETWVQYLGWEDPMEKRMATHSSIIGWKIPWAEVPGGLQSLGSQRVGQD